MKNTKPQTDVQAGVFRYFYRMLKSFDIYNQNNIIKIIVALNLLLVGTASVLYTNRLIGRLEAREERYVQMYAKTLAYVSQNADLEQDLTFAVGLMADINDNSNIPVIYINEQNVAADYKNIDIPAGLADAEKRQFLRQQVANMRLKHVPIVVPVGEGENGLIYFSNSKMLKQLQYFPLVQLAILAVLAILAYLAFSSSRRAEQNRVWVGLAKETAHQLGTPLSSLMAWVEYMRADIDQYGTEVTDEIEKDVKRLETITARFSSIGSVPILKDEDVAAVVLEFTDYLKRRISTKVKMSVDSQLPPYETVKINRLLFEWVIENICKNAVDAMGGIGELRLKMSKLPNGELAIDITDTGKGIPKASLQKVFSPGYSTKKRGWGLGLTLAKRIVEEYHNGRLFVKSSEVGKGTTFRVVLNGA